MKSCFFVTGTDTAAGKTVLTAALTQFLRERGHRVAAFKPICSGGRNDARQLHRALGGQLNLDQINPWHFRRPIAPTLAAAKEGKSVKLPAVLAHLRKVGQPFDPVLIEGAGGLLSPLGNNFDSRDLLVALNATPIIAAPNKLGVVNVIRLTLEALPKKVRAKAVVVLMNPAKADSATTSNADLLAKFHPRSNLFTFPWLGSSFSLETALKNPHVRRSLRNLAARLISTPARW